MANVSASETESIIGSIEQSIRSSLSGLPGPVRTLVEPVVQRNLQVLAKKIRVPKMALYGRTGSGKSSIINAIMGERVANVGPSRPVTTKPESYEYQRDGWKLQFVDSRGVGDTGDNAAFDQAIEYIAAEKVDVLLFVVEVGERGYTQNDVTFLGALKAAHRKKHNAELPIILVLNKIDLVPPASEWNPPYNLSLSASSSSKAKSLKQVKEATIMECIKVRTDEYKTLTSSWVPVCASWTDHEDRRYNIDELALMIFDSIPDDAKPGFAGATAVNSVKKAVARTLIWTTAVVAASTCLVPIPGIDIAVMIVLLTSMVGLIARIGSSNKDQDRVATKFIENIGVYGGGLTLTVLAAQLRFIPVAGVAMSIPAAAAVAAITVALGDAATSHFIEGVSLEEAKSLYKNRQKRMRDEFRKTLSRRSRPEALARKLGEIEAGLEDGI